MILFKLVTIRFQSFGSQLSTDLIGIVVSGSVALSPLEYMRRVFPSAARAPLSRRVLSELGNGKDAHACSLSLSLSISLVFLSWKTMKASRVGPLSQDIIGDPDYRGFSETSGP